MASKTTTKKAATPTGLTDAQIIAKARVEAPWNVPLLLDPVKGKTFLKFARMAADGHPPTSTQIAAATYNWDTTQVWSATQAQNFQLSLTNPGDYKNKLATATAGVDSLIRQSGNTVDPATRDKVINDVFNQGWSPNDPRIVQLIGGTFDATKAKAGRALNANDQVKSIASDYMMPITPDVLNKWAGALQSGTSTVDDITKYFKDQAAGQYRFMAGSIDHITPSDWFAPAKSLISSNLEIPTSQIDFNDPSGKWLGLVTTKDPKTGETIARNNSDIIKEARTNPIYGYDQTQGAKDSAFAIGSQIRSMMGYGA